MLRNILSGSEKYRRMSYIFSTRSTKKMIMWHYVSLEATQFVPEILFMLSKTNETPQMIKLDGTPCIICSSETTNSKLMYHASDKPTAPYLLPIALPKFPSMKNQYLSVPSRLINFPTSLYLLPEKQPDSINTKATRRSREEDEKTKIAWDDLNSSSDSSKRRGSQPKVVKLSDESEAINTSSKHASSHPNGEVA